MLSVWNMGFVEMKLRMDLEVLKFTCWNIYKQGKNISMTTDLLNMIGSVPVKVLWNQSILLYKWCYSFFTCKWAQDCLWRSTRLQSQSLLILVYKPTALTSSFEVSSYFMYCPLRSRERFVLYWTSELIKGLILDITLEVNPWHSWSEGTRMR